MTTWRFARRDTPAVISAETSIANTSPDSICNGERQRAVAGSDLEKHAVPTEVAVERLELTEDVCV